MSLRRPLALAAAVVLAATCAAQLAAAPAAGAGAELKPVAGTGAEGYTGDGGPAAQATFAYPGGLAVAPDGTLYVSDTGNDVVRAVSPAGIVTTVAGTGRSASMTARDLKRVPMPSGEQGTKADLEAPRGLAVGRDGTLYIADDLYRVLALAPSGRLTVLAGTGVKGYSGDGGPATQATLGQPSGVAVGPGGEVYVGDPTNNRLRVVSPAGVITTAAGNGSSDVNRPTGGKAASVPVPGAGRPVVDGRDHTWIISGARVCRLSGDTIATLTRRGDDGWGLSAAGADSSQDVLRGVSALAAGGGEVYAYLDSDRELLHLGGRRVLPVAARLDDLSGNLEMAVSRSGSLFVADFEHHRIYSLRPAAEKEPTTWWPYAVIAALVVASGVLGGLLIRRRLRRKVRP